MLACALHAFSVLAVAAQDPSWIEPFLIGSRALEAGDVDSARAALEDALRRFPGHPTIAWQLAGACARAGESDVAFGWLERAVDRGGGEAALLGWDPDLASLREDPRFVALDRRLRDRAEEPQSEPFTAVLATRRWSVLPSASGNGELVVAKGNTGLFLHDLRARETIAVVGAPGEEVGSAELTEDGRWLATTFRGERTGSYASTLRVYDAGTGDQVREIANVAWLGEIQFSRDGEHLLTLEPQDRGGGALWRTRDWTKIVEYPLSGISGPFDEHLILSPAGDRIMQLSIVRTETDHGANRTQLTLHDADGRELARHGELEEIRRHDLAFSPDGALCLALESGKRRFLHVLDGRTGARIRTIEPGDSAFTSACFLGASGKIATLDASFHVRIWDAPQGALLQSFMITEDHGTWMHAASTGEILLVGRSSFRYELYDARSGELLWSCTHESDGVMEMSFTRDGRRVLADDWSNHATVRDARTGAVLAMIETGNLGTEVAVHPLRDELWVAAEDESLRRIDARTGRALALWEGDRRADRGLHFSPDGRILAALARDRTLRLIEAESGAVLATISEAWPEGSGSYISEFEFAPDGSSLAVTGYHTSVHVYGVPDGKLWSMLDPGTGRGSIAYRPDGKEIAVAASGGRVLGYEVTTGASTDFAVRIEGEVETLAFEPDGERLWIGSDHSKVHVFDVASGALVRSLDLQDLDAFDTVELGNIVFGHEIAITTSSGYGVVAAWRAATGERLWDYQYSGGNPGSLVCALAKSGERAYVWGQGEWSPRIVDAQSGRSLLDLGNGGKWSLHPLLDERRIGVDCDEGLEVLDAETGARRWNRVELSRGGWLLCASTRHVDGTLEALEALHLVLTDRSYPLDALAAALLDPKRVRAAAEGVVLAPAELAAIPTLEWSTPPPRVLELPPDAAGAEVVVEASCADGIAGFELLRDGERSRLEGEAIDSKKRRLTLALGLPASGHTAEFRFRAVSARGMLSRALHLTVKRAP